MATSEKDAALDLSNRPGRGEITDPSAIDALNLRPDPAALDEIRKLEEASILAEQKLGTLRVA